MTYITIADAQANLAQIIAGLQPGEEITIVDGGAPLAQVKRALSSLPAAQAGTAKDKILWIAPDFDAPLEDFEEYTE